RICSTTLRSGSIRGSTRVTAYRGSPQMKTFWLTVLSLFAFLSYSQSPQNLIPVKVELITRAVSKTPVLIAYDKGIYKKYGLDVKAWLPKGEFPGAIETPGKMENADISVDGGVPMVSDILANKSRLIAIGSTDCQVRF